MKIAYSALTKIVYALGQPYLKRRYKIGFDERRGIFDIEKIKKIKGAVWIHAVSVGEVQAAAPFISELKKLTACPILLSTTTPTGANMARELGVECCAHIFYPFDTPEIVARALNAVEPCAYIAFESEMWANFLFELKRREIPSFLVNGRISDRSFSRMTRFEFARKFAREGFSCFDKLMVREELDAQRLKALGLNDEKIIIAGDCKIDAMLTRARNRDEKGGKNSSENTPVFLAGSTHAGEDEQVLSAFDTVKREIPNARLIIVPRHPQRARDVSALTAGRENKNDVVIVDKIGVLFDLYADADAVFVGGSLVPRGGQNLMEPALFGVPSCHGENMQDFRRVSDEFEALGISRTVRGADEIAQFWLSTMRSPEIKAKTKAAAQSWFASHGGAAKMCAEIVVKAITPAF